MKELVRTLNEASKAYYNENREIMSNLEYDRLYDELLELEAETGVVQAGSPTAKVGYEVASRLPKEAHDAPLLSLDKTRDPAALADWLGDREGMISWKLDGLTVVLTFRDGVLQKAVTRGNGQIGEVVTANARTFENLPQKISFAGELVIRGEAVIRYSDFEKINDAIEDVAMQYKNPRNLASGSVRQLSSAVTAGRRVRFYAFSLVRAAGKEFDNSRLRQLDFLDTLGFETVDHFRVTAEDIEKRVSWFAFQAGRSDLPSDGLVLTFDDVAYGESLGHTSKFPRDAVAFKWEDEQKETILLGIEWSASRTGLINPIALFEPVELEGTTVSRASVHNVSILEELQLGVGDRITVYKANMIIPQVAENLTRSGPVEIPESCPVCGGRTEIRDDSGVKFLYCTNENCVARRIKSFTHFVSRNAMNIEGLSEATLEKFIARGFIHDFADLFHLERYREEIIDMDGFGEKSFDNLIAAAKKARHTTQIRMLYSLGIPGIGLANARLICRAAGFDWSRIQHLTGEQLIEIDGIGGVLAESFVRFFAADRNQNTVARLLGEIAFEPISENAEADQRFAGLTFVVTGKLIHFPNRNALKENIESRGGKVTGTVTAGTDYLVNNDIESGSSKNKKAKELGIRIINEAMLAEWMEKGMTGHDEGK